MNYNIMALMGQDVTDEYYADTYDIPREYIGTPKFNEFILDKRMGEVIEFYISIGKSDKEAKFKAKAEHKKAKADIEKLMRITGKTYLK